MKEFEIKIPVKSHVYSELDAADRELIDAAKEATRTSYVPYSHFHVGAAIRMANGEIVRGSNQENAAYPSGICAERTTAFYASAHYPGVGMTTIAIAAWTDEGKPAGGDYESYFQKHPISPCGACRQVLLEYEHKYGPMRVLLYGTEEVLEFRSIADTLPYCFTDF